MPLCALTHRAHTFTHPSLTSGAMPVCPRLAVQSANVDLKMSRQRKAHLAGMKPSVRKSAQQRTTLQPTTATATKHCAKPASEPFSPMCTTASSAAQQALLFSMTTTTRPCSPAMQPLWRRCEKAQAPKITRVRLWVLLHSCAKPSTMPIGTPTVATALNQTSA